MDIETDKRLTIEEAAHRLKVSTKTIQRYLASGFFTRIKVNHRTFLLDSEIAALADLRGQGQDTPLSEKTVTTTSRDIVTLSRDRYERLLIELGELRKERDYLLASEKARQELEIKVKAGEEEIKELRRAHKSSPTKQAERTEAPPVRESPRPERDENVGPVPRKPWWTR